MHCHLKLPRTRLQSPNKIGCQRFISISGYRVAPALRVFCVQSGILTVDSECLTNTQTLMLPGSGVRHPPRHIQTTSSSDCEKLSRVSSFQRRICRIKFYDDFVRTWHNGCMLHFGGRYYIILRKTFILFRAIKEFFETQCTLLIGYCE